MRRCVACRQSLPKEAMLRLVVDAEGGVWPDVLQRAPGRGGYLCLRAECLRRLNRRGLRGFRTASCVVRVDWPELALRIEAALDAALTQIGRRQRARMAIGRDAVMRRMWKNAPMLVLLARDAGAALRRQVLDALDKRRESGAPGAVIEAASADDLGRWLGRERVAVAATDDAPAAKKLKRFCVWHGRMKETEVR